jgi:hypothetical protein
VKRFLVVLLVVIGAAGCGFTGQPVGIVTAASQEEVGMVGCYLMGPTGKLVTDPTYGTAFVMEEPAFLDAKTGAASVHSPEPVAWPPGYTANQAGSEVEVHDASGAVVATTGGRYEIAAPATGVEYEFPDGFAARLAAPGCITPR